MVLLIIGCTNGFFESVDEVLKCDHSNKKVLSRRVIEVVRMTNTLNVGDYKITSFVARLRNRM